MENKTNQSNEATHHASDSSHPQIEDNHRLVSVSSQNDSKSTTSPPADTHNDNSNNKRSNVTTENNHLPEIESLKELILDNPKPEPVLIDRVLRQCHKMMVAGPSKAGKSYLLIELAIAIAEGTKWLEWECTQGRVLYINLELDRASCFTRFKDTYKSLGIPANNMDQIDIWNLRGKNVPIGQLVPNLVKMANDRNYIAVIIDPIYKVINGDENRADQMGEFCNQIDRICTELNTAVVYCHHHSKGAQYGKRSMDRASGSGVFARDADALLDMSELPLDDNLIKKLQDLEARKVCEKWLDRFRMLGDLAENDDQDLSSLIDFCQRSLPANTFDLLMNEIDAVDISGYAAYRIDGTLREFPKFTPVNVLFRHPVHIVDDTGILATLDESDGYQRMRETKTKLSKIQSEKNLKKIEQAFCKLEKKGSAAIVDIASEIGLAESTLNEWFGNGKKGRPDYKKVFEKVNDPTTRKICLRRV